MLDADGVSGVVELKDELDLLTVEAIVSTVSGKEKKAAVAAEVERHQQATVAAKAPSERGVVFQVPRLYSVEQGELELVDRGAVTASFSWDLLSSPPDLSSFRFDEASMTFEVYLDEKTVQFQNIKDDVQTYLPGFAQDRSASDLIGWLDQEIREPSIKQPVLREWLRRAVTGLMEDRGFSLSQLLKGQFILRRKLGEQLLLAKKKRTTRDSSRLCSMMIWSLSLRQNRTMRSPIPQTWRCTRLLRTTLGHSSSRSTTTHSPACFPGKHRRARMQRNTSVRRQSSC